MTKIKELINSLWRIFSSKEVILYIIFGVATSLVDLGVFILMKHLGLNPIPSNNIAWIVAVLFAYITNKIWVFESTASKTEVILREFILFVLARLSTLIMTDIILFIADYMSFNTLSAKIIAMVLTVVLNYIFSKIFIFKKSGDKTNG